MKAQPALHEGVDSEEEEGAGTGPSLKGVLQHMIQQGANSQEGDRWHSRHHRLFDADLH